MAIGDDLTPFFQTAEFAVVAAFTVHGGATQTAEVIFDAPTELLLGGEVLSDEYVITYPANKLVQVRSGDTGTIGGQRYRVREVRAQGDGLVKMAKLSKL